MRMKLLMTLTIVFISTGLTACTYSGNRQSQAPSVGASATKSAADSQPGVTSEGCIRTGCSGQLCKASGETVVSTCVWREEYACYKTARCEKQSDGICGWTPSAELSSCLDQAKAKL